MTAGDRECGLIFRLNDDGTGPALLKEVFLERGWTEFDPDVHGDQEWNIWWKSARFKTSEYSCLSRWQFVNHYPKSTGITRKDSLARVLKLQQAVHGSVYDFAPLTFIIPNDYRRFTSQFAAECNRSQGGILYWICKPADMSRGRGIFIIRDLSELQYDTNSVIQQYISDPWLLGGYKFDIRLYVVVTSYHPLRIYMHNNGIVRFSTEKYNLSALRNLYSHLTNTSINKFSPSYHEDKVGIGPGCKWSLKQLRHYLHQNRIDDHDLWWKIISIVLLTIIPQVQEVPPADNCFELFGFDVIFDKNMKPWLLEVNFSPSLSCDCAADIVVKKDLLADIISLMNLDPQKDGCVARDRNAMQSSRANARAQTSLPTRSKSSVKHLPRISSNTSLSTQPSCSDDEDGDTAAPNILTCSLSSVRLANEAKLCSSECKTTDLSKRVSERPIMRLARRITPHRTSSLRPQTQSRSTNHIPPQIYKSWYHEPIHHRQTYQTVNISHSQASRPVIGGLHRIFPFSLKTKKNSISPRQMVLETHKMIKSKLSANCKFTSKTSRVPVTQEIYDIVTPFPNLKEPSSS